MSNSYQSPLQLGDLAKHVTTGFEGVVVARVQYLEGCEQVCLQPQGLDKDGEPHKSRYFDWPYVDLVERNVVSPRVVNGELVEQHDSSFGGADEGESVVPMRAAGPSDAPGEQHRCTPPR